MTMYDERTNLGQQVARDIRAFFQERVYKTVIPRNIRLGEAPSHGHARRSCTTSSRAAPKRTSRSRAKCLARDGAAAPDRSTEPRPWLTKRPALGRGLSALIPDAPPHAPRAADRALDVDIDLLRPNKFQPRTTIDEAQIEELARSIRANGIIQPIVVRKVGRRLRDHRRRTALARRAARRPARRCRSSSATFPSERAARSRADREHPARGSQPDRRSARPIGG